MSCMLPSTFKWMWMTNIANTSPCSKAPQIQNVNTWGLHVHVLEQWSLGMRLANTAYCGPGFELVEGYSFQE